MANKNPKRPITEQDKINFAKGKKFSKEYQPSPAKVSEGKLRANAKLREIETSAMILRRLLQDEIKNNTTGETITQKEAMLLTLLSQGIKEKNIKAIEMVLKIIGDFTEFPQNNVVINQPVKIDKAVIDKSIKEIMTLADE